MSEDINPELIEKAASAVLHERAYIVATFGVPLDSVGECAGIIARAVLSAVTDDLRAEGAAQVLREAADDLERRINEPGLILAADKYGGYHAGERARGQREADVLRSRADRIEHDGRCPHQKCPGGSLCCCLFEAHDE